MAEAEPLYQRALNTVEKAIGPALSTVSARTAKTSAAGERFLTSASSAAC
jgi:hypothetical protein